MSPPAFDADTLVTVNLITTDRDGKPCIELRKRITDFDLIKTLVRAAYYDRPLVIMPQFQNKFEALGKLCEKGILINEKGEYKFLI